MRVYLFEGIDDSLDLVPLAARRALDVARVKVSLEEWRRASLDVRRALVGLGSAEQVDATVVRAVILEAHVPLTEAPPFEEVSAVAVPEELRSWVAEPGWRALAAIDRYALWKVARGKHPEDVLPRAAAEIAPLSTHVGTRGEAHMVDVGGKQVTARRAVAHARVSMQPATAARLRGGDVAKGDVLATARIAGIQAAKRTSELIPLCHVIALTRVTVELRVLPASEVEAGRGAVEIEVVAEAVDRTGVEMEALTAASVAALTVYDMLKSVDRGMQIAVELAEKSGGKTGTWTRT
jgi:cyclic pyranopterin phosphate synthase